MNDVLYRYMLNEDGSIVMTKRDIKTQGPHRPRIVFSDGTAISSGNINCIVSGNKLYLYEEDIDKAREKFKDYYYNHYKAAESKMTKYKNMYDNLVK